MDYGGLVEQGIPTRIVFKAGAAPTAEVSRNGGAFVASTNAVQAIGSGYFYLDLTNIETNALGPLIVRITSGDPEISVFVQVRSVVAEVTSILRKLYTTLISPVGTQLSSLFDLIRAIGSNISHQVRK